ncbi:MAG: DUF6567 family protein [Bdellovibrionota bacterium]|jgi:hypothetical protein
MIRLIFPLVLPVAVIMAGCSSSLGGKMPQSTATSVLLKEKNYKTIKMGAKGTSIGFRLLGILPITSPNYAEAKADLYENLGTADLEGRPIALANQTEDTSSLYLILFSIPKIVVTADVVEFIDTNPTKTDSDVEDTL